MEKLQAIIIIIFCFMNSSSAQSTADTASAKSNEFNWEVFPFVTYDTDAGFGYGIKGYMRNIFKADESYDLILYNSTKGERWYRVQFSCPDYEVRQGSEYGYALDLIADYDKWISYYFYGIGNSSSYDDRKLYTRVPFEFNILLNKTITADFILQAGLKYVAIEIIDFPDSLLPADYYYINKADQLLFLINANYDTRNSTINPASGISVTTGFESSPSFSFTNSSFSRVFVSFQSYKKIVFPELIFADRIFIQQLIGNNIPVQFLLPIGGNKTLRGFPQDRFLDKSSILINVELRFPLWRRLGGIAGVDAGRVFSSLDKFSFNYWKISPVAGLRYYMDNFVVRADLGISSETIGFYFNFGHIF